MVKRTLADGHHIKKINIHFLYIKSLLSKNVQKNNFFTTSLKLLDLSRCFGGFIDFFILSGTRGFVVSAYGKAGLDLGVGAQRAHWSESITGSAAD